MFVLTKVLPVFIYPLGLAAVFGLAGLACLLAKKQRAALTCVSLSVLVLWASSVPAFSARVVRSLEAHYEPQQDLPAASAIVALGGAVVPPLPPRIHAEISDLGDRLVHAARLYRAGLAPYIITTGGVSVTDEWPGAHAEVAAGMLTEVFGVPAGAVLTETASRNTFEHPPGVRRLLDARGLPADVILVTSAMHMRRAAAVFEKQGFAVYPAPTDFAANAESGRSLMSFFPNAHHLAQTTRAVHEYYGLLVYRVLGRI